VGDFGRNGDDVADRSAETLLSNGFESVPVGGYPDTWTAVGNSQQRVVEDENAASGSRCLRLEGEPRGCWEALADAPVRIPNDTPVRIAAWVGPVEEGTEGCHDHHAGFTLRTETGSWDAGAGVQLLSFQTDGRILASDGSQLGRYEWNEWTRIEVRYEREDDTVTQTYWVDGEQRGSVTRPVAAHEDDLSYLRLGSGEYVVYYDDVIVETVPAVGAEGGATASPTPVNEETASGASGGSSLVDAIAGVVQFVVGLAGLGFMLLLGIGVAAGIYDSLTSGGGDGKDGGADDGPTSHGENDGVRYNEHGELIRED
jgi:hypothetical protein